MDSAGWRYSGLHHNLVGVCAMKEPNWENAPAEATHYCAEQTFKGVKYGEHWLQPGHYCMPGSELWAKDGCRVPDGCLVSRPSAPWSGVGLPPVGTECEYRVGDGVWFPCTITYQLRVPNGTDWEVVADCPHLGGEQLLDGGACSLRPIRTQAQIEEAEREAAITEMQEIANAVAVGESRIAALYDAGYRLSRDK